MLAFVLVLLTVAWPGEADQMDEYVTDGDGVIFRPAVEAVEPAEMRLTLKGSGTLEEDNQSATKSNLVFLLDDFSDGDVHRYFLVRTDEIHPDAIEALLVAENVGETTSPDAGLEPDDQLLPLSEIASHLTERQRVPRESVGQQSRLSEKIEELTQRNLAQEKKIGRQEEVIAELTARLEALEKSARQSARRSLVAIVGHS
jgi:hypothetical protein